MSLIQPFATLAAIGAKNIETRSWKTSYRGPMAIHASKNFPKWARELCFKEPFKQTLVDAGYSGPEKLPRGVVVGITNMYDCQPITKENTPGEPERSFGDYSEGRYALYWKGTKALTDPVPAKGALGLWEWAPGENFPMKRICPDCGDEILTSD
ncbi:MAG TPA: ASCH domain-containing protein [Bacillota bacterium]|nr:ASCH domain-containing protein [Bacillota bacterium]